MDRQGQRGGFRGGGGDRGGHVRFQDKYARGKVPADSYVCNRCKVPGHWI